MTTDLIKVEETYLEVPGARSVEQVLQHKYRIQEIMERVLQQGVHYGPPYPGSDKVMLLLPGAHTLTSTFGLTPKLDIEDLSDLGARYFRFRIKVRLYSRGGLYLGEGVGACSTMEEKFNWEYALNDRHYEATDPGDRRVAFKKDRKAEGGVVEVKQVRANFADKENTCTKIACKRGLVAAVILVLDCSDIFNQDLEELADELGLEKPAGNGEPKAAKPKPKPAPSMPFGPFKGKSIGDLSVTDDGLREMIRAKLKQLENPKRDIKWDAADQAFVAAIEEELKARELKQEPRREDAAGGLTAQPPGAQQAGDAPAPAPATEEDWETWRYDAESQRPTLYYLAKQQLKLARGAPIPPGKRAEFRQTFEGLVAERT